MFRWKEDELVAQLQQLGFSEERCRTAARMKGTFQAALDYLTQTQPPIVKRKSRIQKPELVRKSDPFRPLALGDIVELKRQNGLWIESTVISINNYTVVVEYNVGQNVFTKRLKRNSAELAPFGTNIRQFTLFETVEHLHLEQWIEATITEIEDLTLQLQFGYEEVTFYINLPMDSPRIAKLGEHIQQYEHLHPVLSESVLDDMPAPDDYYLPDVTLQHMSDEIISDEKQDLCDLDRLQTLWDFVEKHGKPKEGSLLDARDSSGKWYPVEVLQERDDRIFVHFIEVRDEENCWINIHTNHENLAPFKTNSDRPRSDIYAEGDIVDIIPLPEGSLESKWVRGTIIQIDGAQVRVHYEDTHSRLRKRWYHTYSDEIKKLDLDKILSHPPQPNESVLNLHDTVEFQDDQGQWHWVEVIAVNGNLVKLHGDFLGYLTINLHLEPQRIRKSSRKNEEFHNQDDQAFLHELCDYGLIAQPVYRDGNDLFRSVAFLIYGVEERHNEIRMECYNYMLENKDFFFLIFGEDIELYVSKNIESTNSGGELELYALSELFNKRIEVYHQGHIQQPTYRIHCEFIELSVIRLSLQNSSQYKALYDSDKNDPLGDGHDDSFKIRDARIAVVKLTAPSEIDDKKRNNECTNNAIANVRGLINEDFVCNRTFWLRGSAVKLRGNHLFMLFNEQDRSEKQESNCEENKIPKKEIMKDLSGESENIESRHHDEEIQEEVKKQEDSDTQLQHCHKRIEVLEDRLKSNEMHMNAISRSFLCQECHNKSGNRFLAPCGHLFCDDCIRCLSAQICPTCRKSFIGIAPFCRPRELDYF